MIVWLFNSFKGFKSFKNDVELIFLNNSKWLFFIFKRIKQVVKNMSKRVCNSIKNIVNSKFVNGIIKPLVGVAELIPVVGGISSKVIENIQKNGNTLGTLLTDIWKL